MCIININNIYRIPSYIADGSSLRGDNKPDFYIDSISNSIILELIGASLNRTELWSSYYTLRFPRVRAVRYDKDVSECITMEELREKSLEGLHNKNEGKDVSTLKDRSKRRKVVGTISSYLAADVRGVKQSGDIFKEVEFCILPGDYSELSGKIYLDKNDVEKKIYSLGGKFVQNPIESTKYIIGCSTNHIKVKNLIKSGVYDIICIKWLLRCIELNELIEPKPYDVYIYVVIIFK